MVRFVRLVLAMVMLVAVVACEEEAEVSTTSRAETPVAPTKTRTPRKTPTPAKETGARTSDVETDWTILVYLDGDNDLEASAVNDFSEMARVGSNNDINIIVQMDRVRADAEWDSTAYGNWETAKRFRVERAMRPTKQNQLEDLGEVNMGDPETLVDFVSWGVEQYPAQRYALIFWDHGASWSGIANDDSSDGDLITLPELASAFATIKEQTGVERFDLIGLDACLMSQIDVLEVIAPYGNVAVASADLEPAEGWAWQSWLKTLADDPGQDAAAIAPAIVKSYMAYYRRQKDPSVTLSAFDLHKVPAITQRFDELTLALQDNLVDGYKTIAKARTYAATYASDDNDYSAIDLGHFAQMIARESSSDVVIEAAMALDEAIVDARIIQGNGKDHPDGTGLTFYFPRKQKYYDEGYLDQSVLAQQTEWADFLAAYYGAGRRTNKSATATKPVLSAPVASTAAALTISAEVSGADVAYVYYFVGVTDPDDAARVQVRFVDYLYPPGSAVVGGLPAWSDDATAVRLDWRASSWYLSNGEDVIDLPLSATDYGSNIFTVDGTYTERKTGEEIPVSVEFEIAQKRGTLVHVWGLGNGANDVPQLYEIEPREGDTFTPDIQTYSDNDAEDEEVVYVGEAITFGTTPLVAVEGPAHTGEYVVGLIVEDVSGDTSEHYSEVTVDNAQSGIGAVDTAAPQTETQQGAYVYEDEAVGLRFEYPETWTSVDASNNKIVVYEQSDEINTSLAVDIAALDGEPDAANQQILDELLDAAQVFPRFRANDRA